jgi:hypothetical protein
MAHLLGDFWLTCAKKTEGILQTAKTAVCATFLRGGEKSNTGFRKIEASEAAGAVGGRRVTRHESRGPGEEGTIVSIFANYVNAGLQRIAHRLSMSPEKLSVVVDNLVHTMCATG